MEAKALLQMLLLVKESSELDPLIDGISTRGSSVFDIAARVTLCMHPLLTKEQAHRLLRDDQLLAPLLTHNASVRLDLLTDPSVLQPTGAEFRKLEEQLRRAEDPPEPVASFNTNDGERFLPGAVHALLYEEAGMLTLEQTNLLAKILLLLVLTEDRQVFSASKLLAVHRFVQLLPKEVLEHHYVQVPILRCLAAALLGYMDSDAAAELFVEVASKEPAESKIFLLLLLADPTLSDLIAYEHRPQFVSSEEEMMALLLRGVLMRHSLTEEVAKWQTWMDNSTLADWDMPPDPNLPELPFDQLGKEEPLARELHARLKHVCERKK